MIQNFKILLCMYSLIVILNFLYLIFKKTYKKKMFWFICVINLCPTKQSYIELYNVNQNRSWLLEYKFYVIVKE